MLGYATLAVNWTLVECHAPLHARGVAAEAALFSAGANLIRPGWTNLPYFADPPAASFWESERQNEESASALFGSKKENER
jgi:hypothetical protein